MPKQTINYAMAATMLAAGATLDQAAKETGAKNAEALRVGLYRRNVTVKAIKSSEGNLQRITAVAAQVLSAESERIKGDFAGLLRDHVTKLKEVKPSKSLKKAQQFVNVLEPFARTAAKVHGWGDEVAQGIIMDIRAADPDVTNSIVVESSCGVDTTTDSVADSQSITQTPQE